MTAVYQDPLFEEHDTGAHPENAGRLRAIRAELERSPALEACKSPPIPEGRTAPILEVHPQTHLDDISSVAEAGRRETRSRHRPQPSFLRRRRPCRRDRVRRGRRGRLGPGAECRLPRSSARTSCAR